MTSTFLKGWALLLSYALMTQPLGTAAADVCSVFLAVLGALTSRHTTSQKASPSIGFCSINSQCTKVFSTCVDCQLHFYSRKRCYDNYKLDMREFNPSYDPDCGGGPSVPNNDNPRDSFASAPTIKYPNCLTAAQQANKKVCML